MMAESASRGGTAGQGAAERRLLLVLLGILLAVTALAYARTLSAGFVWDDADWVLAAGSRPLGQVLWESLRHKAVGSGLAFHYYRPLVVSSFALDGWLWGQQAVGFHATNLLLYLGSITVAYLLARQVLGSREAALVAAWVFALHPVHVEVVAWVQGRQDLLAFAGVAAALLVFGRTLARGASWPRLVASGLLFLGALLCKESVLVGPGLALACWALGACGRGASRQRAAWALTPWILALVLYGILRANALEGAAPPGPDRLAPQERWLLAPILFARYVGLLFWPHPLNAYYEIPAPAGVADPLFLAAIGITGAFLAATVWASRLMPLVGLGMVWFILGILPVLQIVPLKGFTMAERYIFLPSFGLALAVGGAGEVLRRRLTTPHARRTAAVFAAAVSIFWLTIIMARLPDWADKIGFYRAMVRTAPTSAYAHANLGQVLVNEGAVDEGIRYLERAVTLEPNMAQAQVRLGLAYWQQGDLPRAIPALETAARLQPQDFRIQRALAIALAAQGRASEAVTVLHRLEGLHPSSIEVAHRLAAAYAALGDRSRADAYAARATQLTSDLSTDSNVSR